VRHSLHGEYKAHEEQADYDAGREADTEPKAIYPAHLWAIQAHRPSY